MYALGFLAFGLILIVCIFSIQKSSIFEDYLRNYRKDKVLNGVVLIAQDQKIIYNNAFGWSNHEKRCKNMLNAEFLLASITKTYTATAILLLVQKGILNLNKPISEYLKPDHPVWKGSMPESMQHITIGHLLTHSSGLSNYEKLSGYAQWNKELHTPEQVIQFFIREPLSFLPGSAYDYQGSNFLLLGFIIESVTGKSYESFMEETLFKPFKLTHTFAITNQFLSTIQKNRPELSIGYRLDKQTKQLQDAGPINMSVDYAEAAIISDSFDLFAFINALFSNKIISAEMVQKMTTSYFSTPYGAGVGYGIMIDKSLAYPLFSHAGRTEGYESIFLYEPQKKITIIILSNLMGSNIYPLAYDLMDLAYKK